MQRKLLALGAAAALVFAGCSSGGGSSSGGGGGGSFCDLARDVDSQMEALDKVGDTAGPEALKKTFTDAEAALKKASKKAPSEIKDDFAQLVKAIGTFNSVGEKNDYDIVKMATDPELATLMQDESLNTASENIQTYLETECGISGS